MRKKYLHYELVPVEVAEKIFEQQNSPGKSDGRRRPEDKKSRKVAIAIGRHTVPKKVEVLIP
jgi:hypothetical protein